MTLNLSMPAYSFSTGILCHNGIILLKSDFDMTNGNCGKEVFAGLRKSELSFVSFAE